VHKFECREGKEHDKEHGYGLLEHVQDHHLCGVLNQDLRQEKHGRDRTRDQESREALEDGCLVDGLGCAVEVHGVEHDAKVGPEEGGDGTARYEGRVAEHLVGIEAFLAAIASDDVPDPLLRVGEVDR